jgi:hypothetical protein
MRYAGSFERNREIDRNLLKDIISLHSGVSRCVSRELTESNS